MRDGSWAKLRQHPGPKFASRATVLLISPYLLGSANGGAAQWVPMVIGAGGVLYSLLTRYELGVVKLIPMPLYLGLDAASGLLLAASPAILGFSHLVWVPQVILGLLEASTSLITRVVTGTDIPDARQA